MAGRTQDEKDKLVKDALEAWDNRDTSKLSQDEIVALWEDMWKACDFSWEGLADAGWERDDRKNDVQLFKQWRAPTKGPIKTEAEDPYWHEATLQDYWRWSAGVPEYADQDLLLNDEQLETAGLLKRIDGKLWHIAFRPEESCIQNEALRAIVLARISRANEFKDLRAEERALFNGVRATGFMKTLKDAWKSMNLVPDSHNPLHIAANISEFKRAHIPGVTFGEQASFYGTRFGGRAAFNNVTFQGAASFASAQFGSSALFVQSAFKKNVSFDKTQFGNKANFSQAAFLGNANFNSATFTGDTNFNSATFTGNARFTSAIFTGEADFLSATFTGNADFYSATFTGNADFLSATFTGNASFSSATFTGNASFRSANFEHSASFTNAKWGWDASGKKWLPVHYGRAFYNARFAEAANFETDHFNAFAAFDGARFNDKLYLREARVRDAHKQRFVDARKAVRVQIKADVERGKDADAAAVARWSELSSGYQTVKAVMEEHGDVDRAQLYHRFEIQARMKQPRISRPERVAAWFYGAASDYGASFVRPLWVLFLLWIVFALIYLGIAYLSGHLDLGDVRLGAPVAESVLNAFSLSFKNALLNLDNFGGSAVTTAKTSAALFGTDCWLLSGIARFFGALQTISSLVLVFFFGLAVRRKFQIR